jgi:hypothetical protein
VLYQLAQVNVARLLAPLDSAQLAGFVDALDEVNADADRAPGFVWRLQNDDGNATSIVAFEWDIAGAAGIIVNLSVWESFESLRSWVYGDPHRTVLRQRRKWFEPMVESAVAMWWVPNGHQPSTTEAEQKVRELRRNGPSSVVFDFRHPVTTPED